MAKLDHIMASVKKLPSTGKSSFSRSGLVKLGDMLYDPQDPVALYLASLSSEESQRTMYRCIRQFAIWFCGDEQARPEDVFWSRVTYDDIQSYQINLQFRKIKGNQGYKNRQGHLSLNTQNLYMIAVRNVLKKACRIRSVAKHKRVSAKTYQEISEIKLRNGSRLAKTRALTDSEVRIYHDSFSKKPSKNINIRDKALFSIMMHTGLRVNELVTLTWPSSLVDENSCLQVVGKGNKERKIPLNSIAKEALFDYVRLVRGEHQGPIWHPINRAGRVNCHRALTANAIRKMLRIRGLVLSEQITPHYLRKTFGTSLLLQGVDIFTAQDLLGHASADTTKVYDTRGEERKFKAVQSLVNK